METAPNWLNDLGALGLLAVVLFVIGRFVNEWFKDMSKRQAAAAEFNRDIAKKAFDQLETVIKDNTTAYEKGRLATEALIKSTDSQRLQATKEHTAIIKAIENSVK